MTNSLDHAQWLQRSASALLKHAAGTADKTEREEDEAELARVGEELLAVPGSIDVIGDIFDAIVGSDPHLRERRVAILEACWSGIGHDED